MVTAERAWGTVGREVMGKEGVGKPGLEDSEELDFILRRIGRD